MRRMVSLLQSAQISEDFGKLDHFRADEEVEIIRLIGTLFLCAQYRLR